MGMAYSAANWAVSATLGSGGANLGRLIDGRVHTQATAASQTSPLRIDVDLGEAKAPGLFAVLGHNFLAGMTGTVVATVKGANDSGFTTGVVTVSPSTSLRDRLAQRAQSHVLFLNDTSRRYFRFEVLWTGGGSVNVAAAEAWVGPRVELSRSLALGTAESLRYAAHQVVGATGETWTSPLAGPQRAWEVSAQEVTEAEREELRALFRAGLGGARPLLWCPRYGATSGERGTDCLYGRLGPEAAWSDDGPTRFTVSPLSLEGFPGGLL